jgi:hypothetical protein
MAPELDDGAMLVVGPAPESEVVHGLASSERLGQLVIELQASRLIATVALVPQVTPNNVRARPVHAVLAHPV